MDHNPTLSKKQKVTHLSQADWLLQRPDAFVGSMEPTPVRLLTFDDEKAPSSPSLLTTTLRPGFLALANELVTNPLDNCQRDATQRYIKFSWDADKECLVVVNDGSTLPIERLDNGEWAPTMAFGAFQTGSNFDDETTGLKDVAFTAGRNGVGAKGCNVFSRLFRVRIVNAQDRKVFEQTWRDHMRLVEPAKITSAGARKTNETRVEWTPDFARLHTDGDRPPECMPAVCRALAHQAALCAPSHVKVSLDGVAVKLRTPEHFCRALGGVGPLASDTVSVLCKDGSSSSSVVLRLCVAARAEDGREEGDKESAASSSYVFVNATPCPEGSHVKYLYGKIADVLSAKANAKRGSGGQVHVTPSFLRQQAVLVAVLLVEHPRFTSQTKHCLDLPVKDFGWKWEMGEAFRSALERSPLVDRAVQCALEKRDAEAAKATKTSASSRLPSIPKYEPALRRHTKTATLIVCEGDSAANLVRSGLSVVGRKDFGLYPLRGKFLNARGVPSKTVLENKEAMELLKILGIQLHFRYDEQSVQKLPYARLMAMTDQDVDGSHIAGLLYNFVDAVAPSLLAAKPDYLSRFATSLIRVTLGKKEKELGFYSQVEYDAWRRERQAHGAPVGTARYFKGLGTSSAALAKEYFRNLAANTIVVRRTEVCGDALGLAFDKRRADDRKAFLSGCDATASYVDYAQAETTVDRFVRDELLPQYATASLVRAIPSVDGFKEAQRKVFFGARVLHLTGDGISVANAAGKIASRTMYHHRGTAMEDTIVGMAADYAGTGNVNLLLPLGQFGTRHKHAAASAAYPKVSLNAPLHTLLFPPADDAVLTHVVDEGVRVEPTLYAPLLPMPLVFGCKGIATGWSTDVPPFHPVDVLDATVRWLEEGTSSSSSSFSLVPWYRGFQGTVRAVEAKECGGASSSSSTLTFAVRGTYEWKKAGTHELHVTELPPFRETESYKEDWVKKELASEILVGERASDTEVHFVLKGCKPSVLEDPVAALGLEKTVSLGNMHLLNARGRLTKYEEPQAILEECAEMRLGVYEKRLAHLVKREQRAVTLAENKARFVQACVSGEVDLRVCADDEEGGKACEALGLSPMAQDDEDEPHKGTSSSPYDYLLRLPLRSLTRARAAELLAQADHHRRTWEALRAQTPRALFLQELGTLREALTSDPRYAR